MFKVRRDGEMEKSTPEKIAKHREVSVVNARKVKETWMSDCSQRQEKSEAWRGDCIQRQK